MSAVSSLIKAWEREGLSSNALAVTLPGLASVYLSEAEAELSKATRSRLTDLEALVRESIWLLEQLKVQGRLGNGVDQPHA